ncbi:MAG TPA: hypothetical protein VNI54_14155 [Thermoanaerobaculia bacterium]|nr:hypothetical protein [Thermoanaerobaculia bacterium]
MTLLPPRYPQATAQFDGLVRSLLTADQFDDWLPDALYYEDQRNEIASLLARVQTLWKSESIADPPVETLQLHRTGGATLPALVLPLDLRLVAHGVIAALAPRISTALPRDKIYGFRFLRGAPAFDQPGAELDKLFDVVAEAARAAANDSFQVLDIDSFARSANPKTFAETLQQCGARPEESYFLRDVAKLGGSGLASVDDAFAFAYNFYLQPVDRGLMTQKHNFFRYRDEYFVFDDRARQSVTTNVQSLGLRIRDRGKSRPIASTMDNLKLQLDDDTKEAEGKLIELPYGTLWAKVECEDIGEECSDIAEQITFRALTLGALFRVSAEQPLDAVTVLPQLRYFHKERRAGVLLAPPFAAANAQVRAHQRSLSSHRAWLAKVAGIGLQARASWQAGWAATLLSDIGMLTDAEAATLVDMVSSPVIDESSKTQARIALARSSNIAADRFWTTAVPRTEYRRRGMLLAARHLARRNPGPWNALVQAVGKREPELVRHLQAGIRVTT